MTAIDAQIRGYIDAFDGEAAFLARNLVTGDEFGFRPERVMPTASTIKVVVLAELYRQVDAGLVDLDEVVSIQPEDRRGGSGILKDLSDRVLATVRDHATMMIALSDNTSTALLVRLLGRERIVESAREWGMTDTSFPFDRAEGRTARDYAASTPRDLVHLLALIAEDRLISPEACREMRDILVTQQYHEQIARYLPFHQYAREGASHDGPLVVRSKSGFMSDDSGAVRVDAGIVEVAGGPRWVIALMTEGQPDTRFHPEHPGMVLNGHISRLVYDAWVSGTLA
jgi:beta-lactamase class A